MQMPSPCDSCKDVCEFNDLKQIRGFWLCPECAEMEIEEHGEDKDWDD